MKKRAGNLFVLVMLLFIPFISAQEFNPYAEAGYDSPFSMSLGNFSFQTLFYSDWFFGLIAFLVFFTIYLFILRKFFKEVAVILALLLAMASSVGLLMMIGNIFANISPWFIVIIIAIVLFGLFRNLRNYGKHLSITLLIVAILWFAIGKQYLCNLTWMPYRACPIIDTICIIIILIALLYAIWYVFWGRQYAQINRPQPQAQEEGPVEHTLTIAIHGNGTTHPGQGNHTYHNNQGIRITANPGNNSALDHWEMDGHNMGNHTPLNITMNQDHHVTAIFSGRTGPVNAPRVRLFATPNTLNAGQTSVLSWTTINATSVDISQGVGRQGPRGRHNVSPARTTTYIATATGPGGTARTSVIVTVNGPGGGGGGRRNRSIYDLQQKYRDYYMRIWNRGLSNRQRQRILQAMTTINNQLTNLGAPRPSGAQQSPREIYRRLRAARPSLI